ncbi:MAG: mechanosensitive ion channel [Planctomycetes bacterium]|jgi:potassium efflux system protein|nr:mechanosensitive ion channel [Planctomycetota bacterium]
MNTILRHSNVPMWVLCVGLFVWIPTSVAQQADAPPAAGAGPVATGDQPDALSPEAVEAMITAAESLEDDTKAVVLERLRAALADLQQAKAARESIARWEQEVQQLPETVADLRQQLSGEPSLPTAPQDMPAETIEARLDAAEAAFTEATQRNQRLEDSVALRKERLINLPAKQQEALKDVASLDEQLADLEAGGENGPAVRAQRTALRARRQMRQAEANAAAVEARYLKATAEQLQLQRDLAARAVSYIEKVVEFWRKRAARARSAETREVSQIVQQQRQELARSHALLDRLTAENVDYVRRLRGAEGLVRRINGARQRLARTRERLARLEASFTEISRRVEIVGLSETVGALLRDQRTRLPDPEQLAAEIDGLRQKLAETQLAALDLQTHRVALADPRERAERRIAELPAEQRSDISAGPVATVLKTRKAVLDQLIGSHDTYAEELGELQQVTEQLRDRTEAVAAFIDERVLWIRSAEPVGMGTLNRTADGARALLSPGRWRDVVYGAWRGLKAVPLALAGWLVFLAALAARRRRWRRRVRELGEQQGAYSGTFGEALRTLLMTAYLALLVPVALWAAGWLLEAAPGAPVASREVAGVLRATAGVLLPLMFAYYLSLASGLAEAHLRWKPARTVAGRRAVRLMVFGVVPVAALADLGGRIDGGAYAASLGRLLHVLMLLELAVLAAWLGRPSGALLGGQDRSDRTRLRWRWALQVVLVALPTIMLLLAAGGYLYTVRELGVIIRRQGWLLLGAFVGYQLLMRGVFLARRDMARRQIAEQRQAEAEGMKNEEQADRDLRESLERVSATSTSVRRLVGLVAVAMVVLGTLVIWREVLPALGVLERITLWAAAGSDPVSLQDLLGGLLTVVLIFYLARSLPGLLDAFVLQRIGMEQGKRYAITTVTGYVLVGVGVVIVAECLGVRWENLQWIIAALGVGLGFGLQEIFANFVSGLILLVERPVRVGDMVTVGDVIGKVSRIRIRATTIVDFDLKELVIPNKEFVTGQLINWSLSDRKARVVIAVGVAYGSDTERARRTLLEVAEEDPDVLKDPAPTAYFLGFGASSLDFQLRVFIDDTDKLFAVRHRLHMAVDAAFREQNITIAFPQQDVHLFFDDREAVDTLASRRTTETQQ